MAWVIIADLINTDPDDKSYVGRFQDELKGDTYTAKLYDDDMIHCYTVHFDADAYENDEARGGLYCLYEWAMYDVGVTHLCIHLDDLKRMGADDETMRIHEKVAWKTGQYKGWCTIYG